MLFRGLFVFCGAIFYVSNLPQFFLDGATLLTAYMQCFVTHFSKGL